MGISVALAAAGAAFSAYGAVQGASAARRAGDFSRAMAEREASILDQQAQTALELGVYDLEQFRDRFDELQDDTRVAYLKSGVVLENTPLDVLAANAADAEIQEQGILWNAELQSKQIADSAVLRKLEGQLADMKGRMTQQGGYAQAAGSLLAGAGKAYYMHRKLS